MRENRITINITFWTTIITFIGATYFSAYTPLNTYMINLCFAVFGSSLLALIVALSGYFSAKKQVLKQYLDTLIYVLDALGSYRKVTKNTEDILNNVDAVDDLVRLRLELAKIYSDYSPFCRKHNKQNMYIYSSMKYLENFTREAYKHTAIIKELIQKEPKGDTFDFLLNEITEIEKYMFEINIDRQGEEIRIIEKFFVMRQLFTDYVNEYIQFINGVHKGEYSNISLPTKEELQRNKLALQKEYNKLKHKNTLNFIDIKH